MRKPRPLFMMLFAAALFMGGLHWFFDAHPRVAAAMTAYRVCKPCPMRR